MERIDIIDSVYESIQGNYRSVEALMSSLYDKHLQNPKDEDLKLILANVVEIAKGITQTQASMLELYPEDVKQANLPNLDDRYDSLNEGMSTLMNGKSK